MAKKILILSFAGGGIRGYLSGRIIQHLQSKVPFLNRVDLFAGTSTGAIVAAWLAYQKDADPARIVELYRNHGPKIFKKSLWSDIKSVFGYYSARYDPEYLHGQLRNIFVDSPLSQIPKPILIPAQDVGGNGRPYQAKYFDNFKSNSMDLSVPIIDVLMASAAAPSYFRTHAITFANPFGKREFMDGGLNCNHPCVSAIAAAVDTNGLNADIKDVYCLHIATGFYPKNALGWNARGAAQLVRPIIDMATEHYSTVSFQASKILGNSRFCCVGTQFNQEIEMDDPDAIGKLDDHWPNMQGVLKVAEDFISNFMTKNP